MSEHRIASSTLSTTIRSLGAEPVSIVHASGGELLWQAGPAWPKHAPVLFPIVGELANGSYVHAGKTYRLGRHGFAREREFTWTETGDQACTLVLEDDERTRAVYPFRFHFELRYAIDDDALVVTYTVRNPGSETLPASIGAHPAFRWPLVAGAPKTAYGLTFAKSEPEPVRRLRDNLLDPQPFPTPVRERELPLDPSLFDADAIVMDRLQSASITYTGPASPSIEVSWNGFAQLGLWSKAGGDFVCIEPWYGYASPADFSGDFAEKPGLMHLAPGESKVFEIRIQVS